jgi:hypothetical protein
MKIINLAMPAALVTTLLAGCVMPAEDEQIDEDAVDPTTQSEAEELAMPINGREAAILEGRIRATFGDQTATLTSWYSGTLQPGQVGEWYWNNSSLTAAYQVGLTPIGATTSSPCKLSVIRTWDVQKYGGEREFHFQVQNIGTLACGANILLDGTTRLSTWETLGIEPGVSKSWTWNNANPLSASYFVGVSPTGATSANDCKMEVTRTWYVQQPSGEREFKFTVKNIGNIACQGDIQLARTSEVGSSWSTGAINPGATKSWNWNNANPTDRLYVPGLSPDGASGLTACALEVTDTSYRQVINSTGAAEREYQLTVKNVGSLACFGTVLLNHVQ